MYGLNRSYNHLKRVGLNVIHLSLKDLSRYADKFLIENIKKDWVGEQVLQTEIDKNDLEKMNATSCGNLAYVALHHTENSVREKAISTIEKIKSLAQ